MPSSKLPSATINPAFGASQGSQSTFNLASTEAAVRMEGDLAERQHTDGIDAALRQLIAAISPSINGITAISGNPYATTAANIQSTFAQLLGFINDEVLQRKNAVSAVDAIDKVDSSPNSIPAGLNVQSTVALLLGFINNEVTQRQNAVAAVDAIDKVDGSPYSIAANLKVQDVLAALLGYVNTEATKERSDINALNNTAAAIGDPYSLTGNKTLQYALEQLLGYVNSNHKAAVDVDDRVSGLEADLTSRLTALETAAVKSQLSRELIGLTSLWNIHWLSTPLNAITASISGNGNSLGTVVAVGKSGKIVFRSIGISSYFHDTTAAKDGSLTFAGEFLDVAYGNNVFVAVGAGGVLTPGGGVIQYSAGGVTWSQPVQSPNGMRAVTWKSQGTGGIFVAVGDNGAMYSSTNGSGWSSRSSASGLAGLVGAAASKDLFAVVSADGEVQTSSDGVTWKKVYKLSGATSSGATFLPRQIKFSAAQGFVALFLDHGNQPGVVQSLDGVTWTESATQSGSGVGTPANLKLLLLDQQVVYLDTPTSTNAHMNAFVNPTPLMPGITDSRTMYMPVNEMIPSAAQNFAGQVWTVGVDDGGSGVIYVGAKFRPFT